LNQRSSGGSYKGMKETTFVDKVVQTNDWSFNMDPNFMWRKMTQGIRIAAKEVLGESKGRVPLNKDMSWWNNEVREVVRYKRQCYRNLGKCKSIENFEKYKNARRKLKEAIRKVRPTAFKDLYEKMETKDGEKNI
jgi:hypothetical protein